MTTDPQTVKQKILNFLHDAIDESSTASALSKDRESMDMVHEFTDDSILYTGTLNPPDHYGPKSPTAIMTPKLVKITVKIESIDDLEVEVDQELEA